MGLSIYGVGTDKSFSCTYGRWYDLRSSACRADGYEDSLEFLVGDPDFLQKTRFRQFICFSDHDGILVPERYLKGADYGHSFSLGSSDILLQELEVLKMHLLKDRKLADSLDRDIFFELYQLVKKEVKEGIGVLIYR